MSEDKELEQLKKSMQEEFNNQNYNKVIQISEQIILKKPDDVEALDFKLSSLTAIHKIFTDQVKDELHSQYLELAKNVIELLETKYHVHDDNALKYHVDLYRKTQNNLAWELYIQGKSVEDWEKGLEHVDKALNKGMVEYILDTEIRLLLKLGRVDDAFFIVFTILKHNPNARDVQDIKNSEEYKSWLTRGDYYKNIKLNEKDKRFLIDLETAAGREIPLLEKEDTYSLGFMLKDEKIVYLKLYYIYNLQSIPESIGNLEGLEKLIISWCDTLNSLPPSIGDIKYLKELSIEGLYQLNSLTESIGQLKSLQSFYLRDCNSLQNLPNSIGSLESLEKFKLEGCDSLKSLPESFRNLKKLKTLTIRSYYGLESLPESLGQLESLEELNISDTQPLKNIPESIGNLRNLKKLKLDNCRNLEKLPETMGNLQNLSNFQIKSCDSLRALIKNFSSLINLKEWMIEDCPQLETIPDGISELTLLEKLSIKRLSDNFKRLPLSFGNLKNLSSLEINNCNSLSIIPETFGNLDSLKTLKLKDCGSIKSLPTTFGNLKSIEKLEIENCGNLEYLPETFSNLNSLKELVIKGCVNFKKLPENITNLKNLMKIQLENCKNLELTPDKFINFNSIEDITILRCKLNQMPNKLLTFKSLKNLNLSENVYSPTKEERMTLISRRWKKEYEPWRSLVFWGWNSNGDPSYLILYGHHKFMGVKIDLNKEDIDEFIRINPSKSDIKVVPEIKEGIYNVLQDNVKYSCCVVFDGKAGHLSSFKSVKIIQESHYNYETRSYTYDDPALYRKKDLRYSYGWRVDKEDPIKEFRNLDLSDQISFPYYTSVNYEDLVKKLITQKFPFNGFKIATTPNEILKIKEGSADYYDLIVKLMVYQNLYMRKKFLKELIRKNPPYEIYKTLLNVGSPEVISGLFLELAKLGNLTLKEEAKQLIDSTIDWAEYNYAEGVKRCATIYYNLINPELKEKRIKWIRENHPKMDLHLKTLNGKDIPSDKKIAGSAYRKYAQGYIFKDYNQHWDYESKKYVRKDAPKRYEIGPYTDGIRLNQIQFKNTIQEAEIYELAEVIGKIAYYLDAPRLHYYLKGSGNTGALNYFQRYIKRIINSYAEQDERKFMNAMKFLLLSYSPLDNLCKFPENFQFNKLLRYYFYHNVPHNPPVGYRYWSERQDYNSTDQLMKVEGRHEYKPEIWDRHLDIVADIAVNALIDQVLKGCYYILKESPNSSKFIKNIDSKTLIQLSISKYAPISELFMNNLLEKLNHLKEFDPEFMLSLMDCTSEDLQIQAIEYFKRTKGSFSAQTLVNLLFLKNIDRWSDLFQQNLASISEQQYAEFIKNIIVRFNDFIRANLVLSENITDLLTMSTAKIINLSKVEKVEIFMVITDLLFNEAKLTDWLAAFIEELIFSIPYDDLETTLTDMSFDSAIRAPSSRNNRIFSLLKAIKFKRMPTAIEIIDVLDFGTSKMINNLLIIAEKNKEQLKKRFTTLLLMFESEVTALNILAEEVFDKLSEEEQKKMHSIVIDSPVQRAFSFGLNKLEIKYKDYIPAEFIIQMLEHGAPEVKAFISYKIDKVIENIGDGNEDLFMYYVKTLLFLPNKHSKGKDKLYQVLPRFALYNKNRISQIETILLEIGSSNIIIDSERALVTLAKIKMEVE